MLNDNIEGSTTERNIEEIAEKIAGWLKEKVNEANADGLVIGNSGGVDCAVVMALSKKVFPNTTLGIIMPCYSMPEDKEDALLLADNFHIETEIIDLSSTYDDMLAKLNYKDSVPPMALGNIKPRLRMTVLYYYAQTLKRLVAGTSNKSELTAGYFTKYGDGSADLLPIGSLTKFEVWKLADQLGVPDKIINKSPTAGLINGRSDEEEMGFGYEELEKFIKDREDEIEDPEVLKRIKKLYKINEHKRNLPPVPSLD